MSGSSVGPSRGLEPRLLLLPSFLSHQSAVASPRRPSPNNHRDALQPPSSSPLSSLPAHLPPSGSLSPEVSPSLRHVCGAAYVCIRSGGTLKSAAGSGIRRRFPFRSCCLSRGLACLFVLLFPSTPGSSSSLSRPSSPPSQQLCYSIKLSALAQRERRRRGDKQSQTKTESKTRISFSVGVNRDREENGASGLSACCFISQNLQKLLNRFP